MKRTLLTRGWMTALLVMAVVLLAAPVARAAAPLATVNVGSLGLDWQPAGDYEKIRLTVSGPGGLILQREFRGGVAPSLEPFGDDGKPLPDGVYNYELAFSPRIDPGTRQALAAARRAGDDDAIAKLQASGKLPAGPFAQSGTFTVQNGAVVSPELQELPAPPSTPAPRTKALPPILVKDQVIPDDLIVQGSACVGLDCVNNESFGFDTIRMKENNTRVKFEDTSVGTFPTNDWQLTANDSASGGSSKFSIEDITGSRVPFTITAGAATNSIFVDSTGRLGLRTSTPVLDLHINTSNTPSIRLEQNNSGGFTAQTWDVAGNEANFFVRDVTGGSRLPFRIRPGAPTSSVDISSDGDVGIGTASPGHKLHVLGAAAANTAVALIQESTGTTAAREVLELRNNGGAILILEDSSVTQRWSFGTSGSSFVIDEQAHAGAELTLANTGNMTILGTLTENSSREAKENFESLDPKTVLARLSELPMSRWSYKQDAARHIGPVAEDFYAAFGVGANNKGIAPGDKAGVALVAVQGLNQVVQEKDREIADLKSRIETLEKLVQGLAQAQGAAEPQR